MRYLAKILPVAIVAVGALMFTSDADAGQRRRGGCGCGESVAVAEQSGPAVAQKSDTTRTERSYSVEPSREYAPRYRSSRGTSGGAYGLDYKQRQKVGR